MTEAFSDAVKLPPMPEDIYGKRKRLDFVARVIPAARPVTVLDIGCGTGTHLTVPLATALPEATFVWVDADEETIAYARSNDHPANLRFLSNADLDPEAMFDLIIASEVIEHVESPEELLLSLKRRLNAGGRIVLTVPNGYGPFEFSVLFQTLLLASGLYSLLRAANRLRARPSPTQDARLAEPLRDTLAASPHINFFSFGGIRRVFDACGLTVREFGSRTFLCGFGFDQLLRGGRFLRWNTRIADKLPPQVTSDWMFVLEPGTLPPRTTPYRRNAYARFRRRLNERHARAQG